MRTILFQSEDPHNPTNNLQDMTVTGDYIVTPASQPYGVKITDTSHKHHYAPDVSFTQYAEALASSENGIVDLRPIQKENGIGATMKNRNEPR